MLGSAGLYVITKGVVLVRLSLSASVRGTLEAPCIWVLRKVYKLSNEKLSNERDSLRTPFAVHLEKIRNHLH